MSSDLLLHGRCALFEKSVPYDDGFLHVRAGALDRFLGAPDRDVQLVWGGHGSDEVIATTRDRSLSLFADGSGIWFRAVLADQNHGKRGLITRKLSPMNQASVNFLVTDEREDVFLGRRRRSILRAGSDHIAILNRAAFGKHCTVWAPRAGLEMAPEYVRDLERRFQDVCASSTTREFAFAYARVGTKR